MGIVVRAKIAWGLSGVTIYNTVTQSHLSDGFDDGTQSQIQVKPVYSSTFKFWDPAVQLWMLQVVQAARSESSLLVRPDAPSFIETFQQYESRIDQPFAGSTQNITQATVSSNWNSSISDVTTFFWAANQVPLQGASLYDFMKLYVGTTGLDHRDQVRYVIETMYINMLSTAPQAVMLPVYKNWLDFANTWNSRRPAGADPFIVSCSAFTTLVTQIAIIESTVWSFALSIGLNLVAVLAFTGNVLLSSFIVITTSLSILVMFGLITYILQWEFGAVLAIGASTFLGCGVDYSIHLAQAYYQSPYTTRKDKMKDGLTRLGPAILGGALTTAGSACFLFPCEIFLFVQLGIMMCASTLIILFYTFLMQTPIMMLVGPVGDGGSIISLLFCRPCRRFAARVSQLSSRLSQKEGIVTYVEPMQNQSGQVALDVEVGGLGEVFSNQAVVAVEEEESNMAMVVEMQIPSVLASGPSHFQVESDNETPQIPLSSTVPALGSKKNWGPSTSSSKPLASVGEQDVWGPGSGGGIDE